ncbi:hypothetical protein SO802_010134 [Lithocarpus litseifolius]|uniref:Zinc finger PMZ-type domain-containing protein n=1 Tax=Lithocarpus litseifolius TaxID=425828 RepID=A0AAW2DDG1_9ROSI
MKNKVFQQQKTWLPLYPLRSHRDVFPFRYANEGPSASFSYSHGGHFHDTYATHTGHYSENAAHSPINIGGADYHAPYTHVAIEDQHVPYRPMNTSDANYDNPTEHVTQETTCFEFEAQYDQTATQKAANNPNDTHRIAATTENAVHTLSERMQARDNDDQLDDDEVLDDVGDEQEPINEPNHERSPAMAFCQPSSLSFSQNTWDNMTDPTPPFEKPIQSIWDPTQEFYVGLLFADKDKLQAVVKHYHIKRNQTFFVKELDLACWSVRCNHCSWHLQACFRATHGLFEVRKYNGPHTCTESTLTHDHEQLDTHAIEKELRDVVKNDPTIKISSLQQTLYNKFQYRPFYFKVWEAKEKAIGKAFAGLFGEKCLLLCQAMRYSTVFWAFGPSIEGFQHCRPVISIDGTFLYGKYRGTLLIASSWDDENRLFPLAFAIVEKETDDSWYWFLHCIQINVTNREGLCVISNCHPGIMVAIRIICQSTRWYHRFCLRHVASNFNQQIGNKILKVMVIWAGMENQLRKYQITRDRITQLSADGEKYLEDIRVDKWTLAHDGGHRYGAMTTNLSKSFNGILKSARNLPIIALVELTYYYCVAYFTDRYTKARAKVTAGELITAYAKSKFNKWEKKAPRHSVTVFSHEDGLFEIRTPINPNSAYSGNHRHEVNLRQSTCSCQKWQVYKILCSLVIAVSKYQGIYAMRYINRCYHLEEQVACYAPRFRMVPNSVHWNEPDFPVLYLNVKLRREKGRPRTTRL